MSRLFPFRSATTPSEDREPRIVGIEEEAADEVFSALSSETARRILASLFEEPATASDLAEEVDTSLQNVRYHLDNLGDADLVEVVDTWYSERGREMDVYAPADDSVVVFAGETSTPTLRDVLTRLLGVVAILGVASVVVDQLAQVAVESGQVPELTERGTSGGDGGSGGATPTSTPAPTGTPTPVPTSTPTQAPALVDVGGVALSPGALFFLGGLTVVALGTAWWTWTRYRRRPES